MSNRPIAPKKGLFYLLRPDIRGGGPGHGLALANDAALRGPSGGVVLPPSGDPGQYPEVPRLVQTNARAALPRDLIGLGGLWVVSDLLKAVFEDTDPQGFAFAACDFVLADGTPGPPRHLCGVLRTLDAVDEAASVLTIKTGDYVNGKHYSMAGSAKFAFRNEVVAGARAFRTPYSGREVFCDRVLRDALKASGATGLWLVDAADC